jgi:hypothetical protein
MAVQRKAKAEAAAQTASTTPRVATSAAPVKPAAPGTDEEIEQIMSEIEELQQEMGESPAPAEMEAPAAEAPAAEAPAAEEDILGEFRAGAGGSDSSMEDTLSALPEDEEATPAGPNLIDQALEASAEEEAPVAEAPAESTEPEETYAEAEEPSQGEVIPMTPRQNAKPAPTPAASTAEHGSLTLTLSGNMTLNLAYECDGQSVTLGFSDHCLLIQLADGSEFKIPVRRAS